MTALLALTPLQMLAMGLITLFGGVVRGFSGFALSAIVMSTAVLFLAPVELIPLCWWLEMGASILLIRGGFGEADRRIVWGLVITSTIGVPLGLALTTTLPELTTKVIALAIIIALALLQLAKIRLRFLATNTGLYIAGLLAGVVTGLASVGGMVVALYVLSQQSPPRQMRASLVMFLFISEITSLATFLLYGVMDGTAVWRGLLFMLPTMAGVWLGQRLFTPRLEPYYRPFCLALLTLLATIGLMRLTLT